MKKTFWQERAYYRRRNKAIYDARYARNVKPAKLMKQYNISRERLRQILKAEQSRRSANVLGYLGR